MNRTRLPLCILLATLLTACAMPPATPTATDTRPGAERLLQEAANKPPIEAARLRLRAAELLQTEGRSDEANAILDAIDTRLLPPALAFDIARLRASRALERSDSDRALRYLDRAQLPAMLPPTQQAQLNELRAQAYNEQAQPIAAARELIASTTLLVEGQERQQLHDQIWATLTTVTDEQLTQALSANNSYYEQGWFELAQAVRAPTNLLAAGGDLTEWRTLWGNHPAYTQPPSQLAAPDRGETLTARRIGLLLPLSGPLAEPARAISEGFYAALYSGIGHAQQPEVISIDSQSINTPDQLFSLATQQQLDLIVGPLSRDYVERLSRIANPPLPVLALNQAAIDNPSLYQLDLASEQEAALVAQRAWADGHRRVALITPDAEWGQRLAELFGQYFMAQGGEVVTHLAYRMDEDLSGQIAGLLLTDQSQARAREVRRIIGQSVEYEERPRDDIDAILMTALPQDARQIKPMLAFHFAGDLPVYATSHLYEGTPDPVRDVDLNGIRFLDLPWVLKPASATHQALATTRGDVNSRFGRLYALGIDAYSLYPYLSQLAATPGAFIEGETGTLMLNPQGRIVRELPWARFENGVPVTLEVSHIGPQEVGAN